MSASLADEYLAEILKGATLSQVAKKFGKSDGSVIGNALKRAGLPTSIRAVGRAASLKEAAARSAPGKVFIPLTRGKVCVIDADDLALLEGWKWAASVESKYKNHWYATGSRRSLNQRLEQVALHRLILGASSGQYVDHIDGDGLNNCRSNLRLCSHAENMHNAKLRHDNTLGFKNVTPIYSRSGRISYQVNVIARGKRIYRGFDNLEAAAKFAQETRDAVHGAFSADPSICQRTSA